MPFFRNTRGVWPSGTPRSGSYSVKQITLNSVVTQDQTTRTCPFPAPHEGPPLLPSVQFIVTRTRLSRLVTSKRPLWGASVPPFLPLSQGVVDGTKTIAQHYDTPPAPLHLRTQCPIHPPGALIAAIVRSWSSTTSAYHSH